ARRVTDLEGCPKAKYTTVSDFMKDLEASSKNIPLYMGELYLELHRGTLTNQHKIKRNNRKAEILLHNVDFLNSLLHMNGIETLSKSELNGMYETLLVNQFHDILPGTCIPEAHDQCHKEIDALIKEATTTIDKMMSKLVAKSDDITALNAISVDMTNQFVIPNDVYLSGGKHQDIIDINGKCERYVGGVSVPALSISTLETTVEYAKKDSSFAYAEDILTTPFFKVKFDEFGYIESLVNVSNGREVRGTGNPLNAFVTAKDVPYLWDNWDLDADAFCQFELETRLTSREIVADGELQFRIRSTYDIAENSKIIQDMIFYSDNNRIDFDTIVDWKDKHKFLKVGFDININASFARHEIQFGYMERPTYKKNPYEESMFEVCNHKYTDISETRFGVSVLNDCKYGISVDGSNMMLSLHKGGCRPDPRGDFGVHRMKYSLLVHDDAFGTETVVDEAYRFNNPVKVFKGSVVVDTTACVNI
ncbi:MAG: glycoside hydrolase family 38 C-terminal domain-containing protein, partial [Oscillospiraceae bacterium]